MRLLRGLLGSLLIHGLLAGGGWAYLAWQAAQAAAVMEIDLAHSSLLLRPRGAARTVRMIPPEPWVLDSGRRARSPLARPTPAPRVPEPPEEQTTTGEGAPAGNEPAETFLPAAAASRIPEWTDGLITEDDYPPDARRQGREGRVTAMVDIDAEGRVRDVRITSGGDADFNAVVLTRLRAARFRPARDQDDRPIAVRMAIPIVFELH